MVRFVLFLNGCEPRSYLCGAGLLPLHRCGCAAQVESRDEGHALACIAAMVHALLPPGLGQGCIGHPCPGLADEFQGVHGGLGSLLGDAIQRRDLLPEAIRPHFARGQQHIHMGIPSHPVDPHIHADMECIRQPVREPFRQRGLLLAREASRQGRVQRSRRHRISPLVVVLHRIPERFTLHRGTPAGQDQGQRGHILLAGVVRDMPRPLIHHPRGRPVSGCQDRRAPFRPLEGRHGQVEQGGTGGGHGGLVGMREAVALGVSGVSPDRTYSTNGGNTQSAPFG